jgi:hypothetical protein
VPLPLPDHADSQTRALWGYLDYLDSRLAGTAGVTLHWRIGPITPKRLPAAGEQSSSPSTEGTISMADLVLTADQQARLAATGQDADGNPVDLTGGVTFGVDDAAVLTLTDNGDGTALVVTTGPTGSALVTAQDTATGGQQAIGSLAVDVVAGAVTSIQISATAEPQGTP